MKELQLDFEMARIMRDAVERTQRNVELDIDLEELFPSQIPSSDLTAE